MPNKRSTILSNLDNRVGDVNPLKLLTNQGFAHKSLDNFVRCRKWPGTGKQKTDNDFARLQLFFRFSAFGTVVALYITENGTEHGSLT